MRILCIAQDFENTAHGAIFYSLIDELSKLADVDVLYKGTCNEGKLSAVRTFIPCQSLSCTDFVIRRIEKVIPFNPFAEAWGCIAATKVRGGYDIIFSMISAFYYYPLYAGRRISMRLNCNYAIYSVDAIPAVGWEINDRVRRFQLEQSAHEFKAADFFTAINQQMLEYQLTTFEKKKGLLSDVTPLPAIHAGNFEKQDPADVFLYTGTIYGKRKIDYVLKAFERYVQEKPDSRLVLVGTSLNEAFIESHAPTIRNNVHLVGFSNEMSEWYAKATVLVNIEADIPGDVFIASKLLKYITINRIVLCETSQNSPTSRLLEGIESVVICGHDVDGIYQGMVKAVGLSRKCDFADRNELLARLEPSCIARKLLSNFKQIL